LKDELICVDGKDEEGGMTRNDSVDLFMCGLIVGVEEFV
jgi:hypothetical protein